MRLLIVLLVLGLAGCSKEAPKQDAAKAKGEVAKPTVEADVREEKKSIEEAADAAAKLVEAEAREEIGAVGGEPAQ